MAGAEIVVAEKFYVCGGLKRPWLCVILIYDHLVEVRTLDQQPGDAFAFMLGNAVSAQAGGAILAVEFLTVENFVPAFTAFDGSVDELKHKPAAQRNAAKKSPFLNAAAHTCGLTRFSFSEQ